VDVARHGRDRGPAARGAVTVTTEVIVAMSGDTTIAAVTVAAVTVAAMNVHTDPANVSTEATVATLTALTAAIAEVSAKTELTSGGGRATVATVATVSDLGVIMRAIAIVGIVRTAVGRTIARGGRGTVDTPKATATVIAGGAVTIAGGRGLRVTRPATTHRMGMTTNSITSSRRMKFWDLDTW